MSQNSRLLLSAESCLSAQATIPSSKILLIDEKDNWLPVNRRIARALGKKEAEFLQLLHYWLTTDSGKIFDGVKWIYNTYDQWVEQLDEFSKATLRRIINKLETLGIVLSGNFNRKKSDQTKWYTIAYDALYQFCGCSSTSQKEPVDNVSSPCAQNEHITTNRLTTNTGLNRAQALNPFLLPLEEKQPVLEEASILETETADLFEQEACQALETINAQLDKPLEISKRIFKNTLAKRMKTHFGTGKTGLERFREYCSKWAANAFLMGKKAMRSGDVFRCSIGSILSEKMIEASWENKGFFQVYACLEPTPGPQEEDIMTRKSPPIPLPPLTLVEVFASAETEVDRAVKATLYQSLGDVTYQAWFHNTGFVAKGIKNGEMDFFISSGFTRQYVLTHYDRQLRRAFACAQEASEATG